MTETITINNTDFDLSDFRSCACAVDEVSGHIEKLESKKQEIENKLSASLSDFKSAKKLRNAEKDTAEEIDHFRTLLEQLEAKHDEALARETAQQTEDFIARLEKRSEDLAALCLKEIPTACRKLAVIAAALQEHQKDMENAVDMAESVDVEFPEMPGPLQRIAGERAFASIWIKNLRLPLLGEDMDVLNFWPLPGVNLTDSSQDNSNILSDVDELFKAEDMAKTAKALFAKIEKRKFSAAGSEEGPYMEQDFSKPHWYERPRSEWADHVKPNSLSAVMRQIGDPVQFWLDLPKPRKTGAFLHLLGPEERERAIEQTPEEERQHYLDLLMQHASNDLSGADTLNAAQA